jgi:uncharacterized phage protein (TIGR01671 family)
MNKREIKFRAWNGEQMDYDGNERIFDFHAYMDHPIMQYTGLKDKNGKEIYEGDIVVMAGYQNPISGEVESDLCIVEYRDIVLCYMEYKQDGSEGRITPVHDYIGISNQDEECEVIGNIYETPYLK